MYYIISTVEIQNVIMDIEHAVRFSTVCAVHNDAFPLSLNQYVIYNWYYTYLQELLSSRGSTSINIKCHIASSI